MTMLAQPPSTKRSTQFTDRYSPLFVFTAAARESTWCVHPSRACAPSPSRMPPHTCHRRTTNPPTTRRSRAPLFASVKFSCSPRGGFELTINFGCAQHPFPFGVASVSDRQFREHRGWNRRNRGVQKILIYHANMACSSHGIIINRPIFLIFFPLSARIALTSGAMCFFGNRRWRERCIEPTERDAFNIASGSTLEPLSRR